MNALALPPDFEARVLRDEPMRRHTSWRVGGPAEVFFTPRDVGELAAFLAQLDRQTPVMWIGLGSNLLVRDGGIRGAVIDTHGVFDELERIDGEQVWCGAGVACAKLAKQCIKWGLGPAEFFAGIPGTVGGALAMNAGCYGGETWGIVERVLMLDRAGRLRERRAEDFEIGYRHVGLHAASDEVFAAAWFRLPAGEGAASRARIRELLEKRIASQPLQLPNAGSVFRNPPDDHAARLIEAAGLKGLQVGGARVSEKHANFIVNPERRATAADIEALIERVQEAVRARFGVELVREVRIVGEKP